jgi:hypothetical protein
MAEVQELSQRIRAAMSAPLTPAEAAHCRNAEVSERAFRDRQVIDLIAQLPLTETEIVVCRMLGESRREYLAERNRRFETAWLHDEPEADAAASPKFDVAKITQLVAMTTEMTGAEAILAMICWQMADERLPKLQALNRELRAVIAAQRKTN